MTEINSYDDLKQVSRWMFLLFLTNENPRPDHTEGEKRHTKDRGPGSLRLANVLQSVSVTGRDSEGPTEAAWAAAWLICLCSRITKCELPVFPLGHTRTGPSAASPQRERKRQHCRELQTGGSRERVRRSCEKPFIRVWTPHGRESSVCWSSSEDLLSCENGYGEGLILKHAVRGYWHPAGATGSISCWTPKWVGCPQAAE